MDRSGKHAKRWKTYTAGLGACGLVAVAAATDGSTPGSGGLSPEAVVRAVESARGTAPASAGNSSSNSSSNSSFNSSSNSSSNTSSNSSSIASPDRVSLSAGGRGRDRRARPGPDGPARVVQAAARYGPRGAERDQQWSHGQTMRPLPRRPEHRLDRSTGRDGTPRDQ